MTTGCRHHKFTGQHENLLRCERDGLFRGDGGERGLKCGGADYGYEHDIGLGQLGELDQSGHAVVKMGSGDEATGLPGGRAGSFVEQTDVLHAMVLRDARELFPTRAGGDAHEFQFVGMSGNHAQRVITDRAGGTEEDNAFAGVG